MKFPKQVRIYCPFCKKHQLHKVKAHSRGKKRGLAKSERRKREGLKGYGGHGRYSRPAVSAYRIKVSRRPSFVLTCTVCGKSHLKGGFSKARKFELA